MFFTTIFPIFFPTKKEKKQLKSLHSSSKSFARARRELYEAHKTRPLCSRAISTPVVIKKRFGSESRDVLIMCLGNSGPVQAMGAMANGKTNRRQTTRRKRVNFDGGGEDEDASSNDEEEEEKERDGITLEDLHACVLDSECAAAKKFGCGTTRFKTMYALSNLLIVCWLFFIHFFFSTSDARWSNDMGHRRATRAPFSLTDASLSLSLCVFRCRKLGIARWPHRKLHSLLEMYKSLAGYYKVGKETHRTSLFGRLTFFLSNTSRLLLLRVKKILTTTTIGKRRKKNEHLYYHHRNCAKRRRSNRVLNGKASAWRRCTSCGKIWCT